MLPVKFGSIWTSGFSGEVENVKVYGWSIFWRSFIKFPCFALICHHGDSCFWLDDTLKKVFSYLIQLFSIRGSILNPFHFFISRLYEICLYSTSPRKYWKNWSNLKYIQIFSTKPLYLIVLFNKITIHCIKPQGALKI